MIRTSQYIAKAIGSNHPDREELRVKRILLDSRQLSTSDGTLFFALRGKNHDGHDHLSALIDKGVKLFVVEEVPAEVQAKALFLQVKNSFEALQALAARIRQELDPNLIAITGSNGKTIVKEWLWRLMDGPHKVYRNPKSYNSQVGVPLSLWDLVEDADFGIFEAGISQPGEMANLAKILQPNWGIFTNIGTAHGENFSSQELKIREKLKLFEKAEHLIYPNYHPSLSREIEAFAQDHEISLYPWSFEQQEGAAYFEILNKTSHSCEFNFYWADQQANFSIPFTDEASLQNVGNALYLALLLDYDIAFLQARIQQLQPVEMRLQMKEGREASLIINDAYNSDLESLRIALHSLAAHGKDRERVLVLSDLHQSPFKKEELYEKVAEIVAAFDLERVIAIGGELREFGLKSKQVHYFETTSEFLQAIHQFPWRDRAVLLKGSRYFAFERIDRVLSLKRHETVLEVHLDRLVHNLNFYRSRLRQDQKLMVMVKAFAYGSGSEEVARVLQFHGVDYLAVAYADEGIALRKSGVHMPIMVLNTETEALAEMLEYDLEPEIYSLQRLKEIDALSQNLGQRVAIHLKLETGMHRLGFEAQELDEVLEILQKNSLLKVESAFSHLAASEDPEERDFTLSQISALQEMTEKISMSLGYSFLRHIANTGAIENYPEAYFDMVRLGIGLYGVAAHPEEQKHLRQVTELKATVSQVKRVKAGGTVGYGRTWKASTDSRIAVISIGYADGFPRRLGNGKAQIMIGAKLYPVVGNVCMDMLMVEVGNDAVKEGDEALIFGLDYPIQILAEALETIPYEVLTGISPRVKRLYYMS